MATEEGTFKTRDGTSLYTKTWKPSSPSPLHLIFLHGFSDHINAYYNLFPTLSSPPYNITIHGFDQRGWGRSVQLASDSKAARGLTGDTQLVLSDIHDFVVYVSKQISGGKFGSASASQGTDSPKPQLFMMGHSMGGAEALLYALTNTLSLSPISSLFFPSSTLPLSGILLESPHIVFSPASQPSPLLVFSGRLASKLLPNMQMLQRLDSSAMSRDPKVCKDWEQDELCHDTGTLRGLAGLLDRAAVLDALGRGENGRIAGCKVEGRVGVPVFWAHGTEDRVCGFEASKRLFGVVAEGKVGSVFKGYEGGFHKLHAEPDGMGEQFARDVGGWIVGVAGVGSTGKNKKAQQEPTGNVTETQEAVVHEDSDNVKSRL